MQGRALGAFQQGGDQGPREPAAWRAAGLAHHDLGDVVQPGIVEHRGHQIVAAEHHAGPAELVGQLQGFVEPGRGDGAGRRGVGPLHMGDDPRGVHHHVRQTPPGPHQGPGRGVRGHQHQDALAGRPGALDACGLHGPDELVVHRLGGAAQGQFAQRREILGLEEPLGGHPGGVGHIDLALGHPLPQFGGGDVDQLDLVGAGQCAVWHGFALAHPGDPPDHLEQALQVLDI